MTGARPGIRPIVTVNCELNNNQCCVCSAVRARFRPFRGPGMVGCSGNTLIGRSKRPGPKPNERTTLVWGAAANKRLHQYSASARQDKARQGPRLRVRKELELERARGCLVQRQSGARPRPMTFLFLNSKKKRGAVCAVRALLHNPAPLARPAPRSACHASCLAFGRGVGFTKRAQL
jgi:hypothetical protein